MSRCVRIALACGLFGCAAGNATSTSDGGSGGAFTSSSSTTGGGQGGADCGDRILCGETCVDPASDMLHCGGCDATCKVGANGKPVCDEGTCRILCDEGYADCDKDVVTGCEADLASDPLNCGACGLAPVEQCNGEDDNCSGGADEGCPAAVVVASGGQFGHLTYGNAAGGALFNEACSPGFAVYRFSGYAQGNIDRIQAHCGRLELAVDKQQRPFSYRITRGSTETLTQYGGYESTPYDIACPENQFVVGISGEASKEGVHDLEIHCAEILLSGKAGAFEIGYGPISKQGVDGSIAGQPFTDLLAAPKIVDRYQGRAGLWLDAVGIGDATVSVMLSP